MVPNSQTYPFQSPTPVAGGSFPFQASFSDMAFPGQMYPSQSLSDQNMEPNSPEVFKTNIRLIQNQLSHVRNLTREALDGIERAYLPQISPAQTAANIANLKQAIFTLNELLRSTGVGGLPVLTPTATTAPPEDELAVQTNKTINLVFNRQSKNQEAAADVAHILAAPEQAFRR